MLDWYRHRLIYLTLSRTDGMYAVGSLNGRQVLISLSTEVRPVWGCPSLYEVLDYFRKPK